MRGMNVFAAAALAAASVLAGGTAVAADACNAPAEMGKITVMADWLPWASQGPIIAAQEKGLYKAEGLEVELISPAAPSDPIKLVARQRVQFSMTYPPEIMVSRDTGIPIRSVGALLRTNPWVLVVEGGAGIAKPADLKGKTIGVSSTLAGREMVETLLKSGGLDPKKDVTVVAQGYSAVQLITTGKVSAITGLAYGELVSVQNAFKKANKTAPLGWNFTDYGVPNFYFMVFAGNEDWVKKNPATTCRFLRATQKGHGAWTADFATYDQIFAKRNEVFPLAEHADFSVRTAPDWKDASGGFFKQDEATWKSAQDWALSVKLITVGSNASDYFTNEYLPN